MTGRCRELVARPTQMARNRCARSPLTGSSWAIPIGSQLHRQDLLRAPGPSITLRDMQPIGFKEGGGPWSTE
jgi:hypothetical protein